MSTKSLLSSAGNHISHENVCLVAFADSATLDRLLDEPSIRSLVWTRFDATRALVDPTRTQLLAERLRRLGVVARCRGELLTGGTA